MWHYRTLVRRIIRPPELLRHARLEAEGGGCHTLPQTTQQLPIQSCIIVFIIALIIIHAHLTWQVKELEGLLSGMLAREFKSELSRSKSGGQLGIMQERNKIMHDGSHLGEQGGQCATHYGCRRTKARIAGPGLGILQWEQCAK